MGNKRKEWTLMRTQQCLGVVMLLLIVAVLVIGKKVRSSNEITHTQSFDWAIDDMSGADIFIYVDKAESWTADDGRIGNQYEAHIINRSYADISDWNCEIKVPKGSVIGTTWNGKFSLEEEIVSYHPNAKNTVVNSRGNETFGFIMYSDTDEDLNEITMNYRTQFSIASYWEMWVALLLIIIVGGAMTVNVISANNIKKYKKSHASYKNMLLESLQTISNIIDTKDEYTCGHSLRVGIYSKMLAEKMNMSDYEQERIYYIGLLHDIGKVGIPQAILTKPGKLTPEEYEVIKRHTDMGTSIMKDFSSIKGVVNGVRYHHERYDGNGYNEGLKGKEIPLEGRIICVADSYDAMSSRRCYRNSLSYETILEDLHKNSGVQFDPQIVQCMIELIEEGRVPISSKEMEEYII